MITGLSCDHTTMSVPNLSKNEGMKCLTLVVYCIMCACINREEREEVLSGGLTPFEALLCLSLCKQYNYLNSPLHSILAGINFFAMALIVL